MVFNSLSTQVMEGGMDSLWLKMQVHLDNIANYSTPEYKTKKVEFHDVFDDVNKNGKGKVLLRTSVSTDDHTEGRIDGNNVDMEYEQLELWKAQAQYAALTSKLNADYTNLRTVISNMSR